MQLSQIHSHITRFSCFQLNPSIEDLSNHICMLHAFLKVHVHVPNHGTEHQCHVLEELFPNCGPMGRLNPFQPLLNLFMPPFLWYLKPCLVSVGWCSISLVLSLLGSGEYVKALLLPVWLLHVIDTMKDINYFYGSIDFLSSLRFQCHPISRDSQDNSWIIKPLTAAQWHSFCQPMSIFPSHWVLLHSIGSNCYIITVLPHPAPTWNAATVTGQSVIDRLYWKGASYGEKNSPNEYF